MNDPASRLKTSADGTFRVLQVTDFHDHENEEAAERTWRDVRQFLAHFAPDLLAVTGDIWCGDELPREQAEAVMRRDIERLESLGVPWAFCWGNHDYIPSRDLAYAMEDLAAAQNSVVPHGADLGDYRIEVTYEGEAVWDLFFLDSRAEGLGHAQMDCFAALSRALQRERGRIVPAIAYFHVPLKQYETAWHEGRCRGIRNEDVLYYNEDGSSLQRLKEAGVRACFVGHSHVNDYHCDCDGVVLAYGRTTGHGGYGGDQLRRGAKLLALHADGRFAFETVFPDGTREGLASGNCQ